MAMSSPPYRRRPTAPDATIGGPPPTDRASRRGEGLLAERARNADLAEWQTLGRHERAFLGELTRLFYLGKGAAVRHLSSALQRRSDAFSEQRVMLLEEIIDRQTAQLEALDILDGHIDSTPVASEQRDTNTALLRRLFAALAEPLDSGETSPRADFSTSTLAVVSGTLGVYAPTAFNAIDTFIERTGSLSNCRRLLRSFAASDRRQLGTAEEALREARQNGPEDAEALERRFERSVLPCIELIRQFQRYFDFLDLALVPDELVAFALDRYFELEAADISDPRNSSGV